MATVIKRIEGMPFHFGGQPHSGWLPHNAATPRPTPIENVTLDLTIQAIPSGYLLEWRSRDDAHRGDTWHETIEDALEQARLQFGVKSDDWSPDARAR